MKIKLITNSLSETPVKSLNNLPFVYLPAYHRFIKKKYNSDILLAVAPEEGYFVLLSIIKTKALVNAQLLSAPFSGNQLLDDQRPFLDALTDALKKEATIDRLITPQNHVVFNDVAEGSLSCNFGSYIVDLNPPVESLFSNVHSKHRNKINKAERAGVMIKEGADQLDVFFELYQATMKRSDMYCEPKQFFIDLFNELGPANCYCAVVYHEGKPQGTILAPYTSYCCYYVYGASSDTITESGSINYMHWQTILEMKDRGVARYDFVGARLSDVSNTKLEGIQSFKERFGGDLHRGYLWKKDLNVLKCKLYEKAVDIKNRLTSTKKFKDIIDQEIEKQSA